MNNSSESDDLINFLEESEYIEIGEWDKYRGLDLNERGAKVSSFKLHALDRFTDMRTNYLSTTLPQVSKVVGDIMVDQHSYSSFVKKQLFGLAPTKFEQLMYETADDIASGAEWAMK